MNKWQAHLANQATDEYPITSVRKKERNGPITDTLTYESPFPSKLLKTGKDMGQLREVWSNKNSIKDK